MGKMKSKVAVVIPSYKNHLSSDEIISLSQCRNILKSYDRFFVLPDGMSIDYLNDEKIIYVDPKFLSSRNMYSEFVLSYFFYDLFEMYEYILIYQLDAFVFSDRLEYFCELKFDYYGAKWPYGMECHINNQQLWYYGNGGFSLRNVSAFKKWIITKEKEINDLKWIIPEDIVIASLGCSFLKFANDACTYEFAFELNPEDSYIHTGLCLPFGCHGWNKFGRSFWKPLFENFGYKIEDDLSNQIDEFSFLSDGKIRREKLMNYYNLDRLVSAIYKLLEKFNGEIYIFGAGLYGLSFLNMLNKTDIVVKGFLDNDSKKRSRFINGVPVMFLSDVKNIMDIPIVITVNNPSSIIDYLESLGFKSGVNYITSGEIQTEMMSGV